jgi:hypothetical protein
MDIGKKLWLVFQFMGESEVGIVADFAGVFDSREKAIAACRDATYCIQTTELNATHPHEPTGFEDCEYPLL